MKVVVALTQPPLPEGGAPGRCAVGLLRGLAEHGLDVRAVAARQYFAEPGEPPADLPVEIVEVERAARGWATRRRMLTRPRGHLSASPFGERVRELARDADVLHLEEIDTLWCDEGVATPSVAHLHYLVRRDRSFGPPWRRHFVAVAELALAERAARRRHRWLAASSPLVAAALRERAPRAEVVVAPLALDPSAYPAAPLDGPPVAGIIGTAAWAPTANAFERLLTRIWPRVRAEMPDARLRLAGRGTAALKGAAGVPGVELAGEVPSASQFLRGLSLLLYPLERGSGMKVKVMEALASGVPVVTTPLGVEGVEAGAGAIVEADDRRLAAAAVSILRDASERRERGSAARAAFAARYSPAPATRPLVELYERMAAG